MNKKRIFNKKKLIKFLIIMVVVILLLVIGTIIVIKKLKTKEGNKKEEIIEVIDTIEKYGYTLDDNETEYYNSLYEQLKSVLNSEELDERKYAESIVKLFLADFFTLDNKITKHDIGGEQFVYESFRNDFKLLAEDSVYRYVESNIYNDRTQKLPIVDLVEIEATTNEAYKYGDKVEEAAYVVNAKITYKEDLGYQNSATIYLIHNNEKLEIAEMK